MKKFLALIGCLMLTSVFFFGCSFSGFGSCGGETVAPILSEKPWANVNNYEQVTYKLERYTDFDGSTLEEGESMTLKNGTVEAEGTYTTTIETIDGNIYLSEAYEKLKANTAFEGYFDRCFGDFDVIPEDGNSRVLSTVANTYTLFTSEYVLTFNEKSKHAGKTDKMTSVVLLKTSSLLPVFSVKKVEMETAPANSYETLTDYINRRNKLSVGEGDGKEVMETTLKKNLEAYDQESLFVVLRAHSALTPVGGASSVVVHNAVYDGLNNQKSRTIAFQPAYTFMGGYDPDNKFLGNYVDAKYYDKDVEKTADGKPVLDDKGEPVIEHYQGYELPVYAVIYHVSDNNHGPTKSLIYSAAGFEGVGATTEKVLMGFTETDTDANGNITFVTVGTIDGYTTDRATDNTPSGSEDGAGETPDVPKNDDETDGE